MKLKSVFSEFDESSNRSRHETQKNKIISLMSTSPTPLTIPELHSRLRISTPTVIKLVNLLLDDGTVIDGGKRDSDSGRKPTLYKLNVSKFFSIGVEVLFKRISLFVVRLDQKIFYKAEQRQFKLENTIECLDFIENFIKQELEKSGVSKESILGVGIALTGRINALTGESFNFFDFTDKPLAEYFRVKLGLKTLIDNDTHILGLAEQTMGNARGSKNALILNVGRGLGMTIISNGKLVIGNNGFAGEFGHMQIGKNRDLCICGKLGCLGMEVSGFALEEKLQKARANGDHSLLDLDGEEQDIHFLQIIDAAKKGDGLSIDLIQEMGFALGFAIGNIVNLLNPEIIIIGGEFAQASDIFIDPVKTGIKKSALTASLKDLEIKTSKLNVANSGVGSAALIFRHYNLL